MEADPLGWMAQVPGRLRQAAERVGRDLGARGQDLVFVDNATTGVNTVLSSLRWRRGDRIVTTQHTYGAVREAVARLGRREGIVVDEVVVPFPSRGPDEVCEAIEPRLRGARLAILDAVTSPTGLVLPIERLVRACHDAGVSVLVDAAHAPGLIPVDLTAWGADWVTANLHKWAFAPRGTAVLYARPDRQRALTPLVASHDVRQGWPVAFDWPGTRDFSAWLAAPASCDWLASLGPDRVRAHNDGLCDAMADHLAVVWGVPRPAPRSMCAAMATLPLPVPVPADAAATLHDALRASGIEVPCVPFQGRTWVRISAQLYNEPDDYARLGRAVVAWCARTRATAR